MIVLIVQHYTVYSNDLNGFVKEFVNIKEPSNHFYYTLNAPVKFANNIYFINFLKSITIFENFQFDQTVQSFDS